MNLGGTFVDINAIRMKEKLDFGQSTGLRRDNRPKNQLTSEEV
jgi:hypothetical protein